VNAAVDRVLDQLTVEEVAEVGAPLGQPLGGGGFGIALQRRIDD
jgi:hypothetical protein